MGNYNPYCHAINIHLWCCGSIIWNIKIGNIIFRGTSWITINSFVHLQNLQSPKCNMPPLNIKIHITKSLFLTFDCSGRPFFWTCRQGTAGKENKKINKINLYTLSCHNVHRWQKTVSFHKKKSNNKAFSKLFLLHYVSMLHHN